MSAKSDAVKKWRKNTKARMIRAFGGKCCVCGYSKCDAALEFHHIDPSTKEAEFGEFRGSIRGWDVIVAEMRKCVMVCSNCHKEIHNGATSIPDNAQRIIEELLDYKSIERGNVDLCVCGKEKLAHNKTCSYECAARLSKKSRYAGHDIEALLKEHGTNDAVGELFGVSGAAIWKHLKKLRKVSVP